MIIFQLHVGGPGRCSSLWRCLARYFCRLVALPNAEPTLWKYWADSLE